MPAPLPGPAWVIRRPRGVLKEGSRTPHVRHRRTSQTRRRAGRSRRSSSAMCAALEHRGPDSRGVHVDGGVGLGIQRLRVIDLETGDQPIYNEDRSVAVVLNGEIYNYRELRERPAARAGHRFATDGDTEVIAHLYEEEGADCVRSLHGMFAFALWDARRRRLLLARDRVGKKPLFYADRGGVLSFASELRALLAGPARSRARSTPQAIDAYLAYRLRPGAAERLPRACASCRRRRPLVCRGRARRRSSATGGSTTRASGRSTIAARARRGDPRRDPRARSRRRHDRRRPARRVPLRRRRLLGGRRGDGRGRRRAGQDVLDRLRRRASSTSCRCARLVAERFCDRPPRVRRRARRGRAAARSSSATTASRSPTHSAIPSFYLAELARRHVTVALNGDGGDESFAGYHALRRQRCWPRGSTGCPRAMRRAAAGVGARLPASGDGRARCNRARRAGALARRSTPRERYARYMSCFDGCDREQLYTDEYARRSSRPSRRGGHRGPVARAAAPTRSIDACSRSTSRPTCPATCW